MDLPVWHGKTTNLSWATVPHTSGIGLSFPSLLIWFGKMEQRTPPPILFAYLGRRDCRFILNEAGVVPLTGFLCVYPWDTNREAVQKLWHALNHPDTIQNLAFAGKSYGGGAVKVEPRQLDSVEIPTSVAREVGLKSPEVATELFLLEEAAGKKSGTSRVKTFKGVKL